MPILYSGFLRKIIYWLPLAAACAFALILVVPTIADNIADPNMITYFNADEGGLMDEIWHYYSGKYSDSFQWDFDYGLEMVYLADLARFALSGFMEFTRGAFVFILRWIHLSAWICALIALWRLVSRHFGKGWRPALAVFLLASRPAFAYFTVNLKPEPLVLLFMIAGLDYILRLIDDPCRRNLLLAIACAALAFIVKFAGPLLLPAAVASMYLSKRSHARAADKGQIFPIIRIAWILPFLIGLIIIALLIMAVVFYVRKSTGFTWYQQFGFWGGLTHNRMGIYLFWGAIFLIFLSIAIWVANKVKNNPFRKVIDWVNEINSLGLIVFLIFIGWLMVFGVRWIITPKYFVLTYSQLGTQATVNNSINTIATHGLLYAFFENIIAALKAFDPIILVLFLFYAILEIYGWRKNVKNNRGRLFKRITLLVFLIPFFVLVLSMVRMTQHLMIPFFVAMSLLVVESIDMFIDYFSKNRLIKNVAVGMIALLFIIDIGINGVNTAKSRLHYFKQEEDVVYELAKWFSANVPKDTSIVADSHIAVYIPPGYNNVKVFKGFQIDGIEQFRRLVDTCRPKLLYYDAGSYDGSPLPPIDKILPGRNVRLVKSFESKGRRYERRPDMKFVIYEVSY